MQAIIHPHPGAANFDWLLSLPRQVLDREWYGNPVSTPLEFAFGVDEENLWFLSARSARPEIHPNAIPGAFTPELWKYDVAEFFLARPSTGQYWEFNLCPNGAWWACGFKDVRIQDVALPLPAGVETRGDISGNSWLAMSRIPLDSFLPVTGGQPGKDSLDSLTLAVTAILDTPEQIFLTTGLDKTGQPDFHRPDSFPPVALPV